MTLLILLAIVVALYAVLRRRHDRRLAESQVYRECSQIDRKTADWLAMKPSTEDIEQYRQMEAHWAALRRRTKEPR